MTNVSLHPQSWAKAPRQEEPSEGATRPSPQDADTRSKAPLAQYLSSPATEGRPRTIGERFAGRVCDLLAGKHVTATSAEIERARPQAERWATTSTPFALANGDTAVWFAGSIGHVVYQFRGRSMIVLGEPVCKPGHERALLRRLDRHARAVGRTIVFFTITPRWMPLLHDFGYSFFNLGNEAVVNLKTFSLQSPSMAYLRRAIRRCERESLRFEWIEPWTLPAPARQTLIRETCAVNQAWLCHRRTTEKQFSQAHFSAAAIASLPVATARNRHGELVGFLTHLVRREPPSTLDGPSEMTLDLARYRPGNVWALTHFMVANSVLHAQNAGLGCYNLSMAPVFRVGTERHSRLIERIAHRFSRGANGPFNDEGLRQFKDQYQPRWEPRYMAYRPGWTRTGLWRAFWETSSLVMAWSRDDRARILRSYHEP